MLGEPCFCKQKTKRGVYEVYNYSSPFPTPTLAQRLGGSLRSRYMSEANEKELLLLRVPTPKKVCVQCFRWDLIYALKERLFGDPSYRQGSFSVVYMYTSVEGMYRQRFLCVIRVPPITCWCFVVCAVLGWLVCYVCT